MLQEKRRLAIPIMTHPGIEIARRTVQEAVTDGSVHAEAILALNGRFPADAATAIMDLTVEAEAFGAQVVFRRDDIPTVTGRTVSDIESVRALRIPSPEEGRAAEYLKANRIVAENIRNKPVYAGCIGPFSLAGRLYGMTELMMGIYLEPETVTLLLDRCAQYLEGYAAAIKQTGVSGVIMAEPAAGLISNEDCISFSTDYVRRIVDKVQDDSFTVILHNCGNMGHCTDAMARSGARGLHFGNRTDMVTALRQCPPDLMVMGNIDPVEVIRQGSEADVRREVTALLEATSGFDNFILSTGCDVPPQTPLENVAAFYEALNEFNNRQI